jgi:hypothetical protein
MSPYLAQPTRSLAEAEAARLHSVPRKETMIITVEVRSVYGQTKVYPICEQAKLFARIAGTTTLTGETLGYITLLGYDIVSTADADWRKAA